jgi:GT2 family glycosyltransferase
MWGLEKLEFKKSDTFRFLKEGEQVSYFVNFLGKRVLTDKVGKAVWEALPGTGERILQKVRKKYWVSERLLYEFLYVLTHAGIIRENPDRDPSDKIKEIDSFSRQRGPYLVSVIVVTYNGEEFINTCLESITHQSYGNVEIICVDNHSADQTPALIKEHFPQVRLKELKRNHHYAGGINQGLQLARGQYVFIVNQDTELDRQCVSWLVKKAESEPEAGAVVPMMKFARLRGFINGIGNQVNNHDWGTDNFIYCVDIGQFEDLKEVPSACFGAVLLRREAVDEVGPVDTGYGSFYEDVDWSLRCWFRGWKIVPASQAVIYHEFGGSYPEGKKLFFAVRNRLRMVLKLFQGRVMLGFLKNYMREDLACMLSFLRMGRPGNFFIYVRAYLSLLIQIPEIMGKRYAVMQKKEKGLREREVLIKNPSFYCCLHPALRMPQIDTAVIRRYYRWCLLKAENGEWYMGNSEW